MSKGETFGGACARTACDRDNGAWWWNTSTRRWYCGACAWSINNYAPGLCVNMAAAKGLTVEEIDALKKG